MKKSVFVLFSFFIIGTLFSACSDSSITDALSLPEQSSTQAFVVETTSEPKKTEFDYSAYANEIVASDGTYELAFITNGSEVDDGSVNQNAFEAIKRFARENSADYKYYIPDNQPNKTKAIIAAIDSAAENGAAAVVCCGNAMGEALAECASEYSKIGFFFIDGYEITDKNGNALSNVAPLCFSEEQIGFIAGYAAVSDSVTSIGFYGVRQSLNQTVSQYGYGFLQGVNACAVQLGKKINVEYYYGSPEEYYDEKVITETLSRWYKQGTQVILVESDYLLDAAVKCAEAQNGKVISFGTQNSLNSDAVYACAEKSYRNATLYFLKKAYGSFSEAAGKVTYAGVKDDCMYLLTDNWKFENFTTRDYYVLVKAVSAGTAVVRNDNAELSAAMFTNLNINF